MLDDPQLHRGMITMAEHPVIGPYRAVGPGMILDDAPLTVRRPAPVRSEHTVEVLAEVGYDDASIAEMIASGAAHVRS
ncbi:MAG: hypothetical protein QM733_20550 [Ilumatobacteraceae bacterium]